MRFPLAAAALFLSATAFAQDLENPYDAPYEEQAPPAPQARPPAALPAYAPLKTVGIMLETQQALFWDEQVGEYKLGKLGGEVSGWRVVGIQADKVILVLGDSRDEIPLTPAPTFYRHQAKQKSVPPVILIAPPTASPPAVEPTTPTSKLPVESSSMSPPPRAPEATITPQPPTVVTPPVVAAPVAKKPIESRHRLTRAELDRQLGDFDTLMRTVTLAPADGGGFQITSLEAKSWLAGLGFRVGDIVRTVAGERVATVDDAARVYARVLTSKTFAIEADRGDDRLVMRFEVR
jgi:hypothetical protein